MDWLIFGDDYAAHPSTTQHLVRGLPATDRVVWVDSIGMRRPRLTRADSERIWGRIKRVSAGALRRAPAVAGDDLAAPRHANRTDAPAVGPTVSVVRPTVLPWHDRTLARVVNRAALGVVIRRHLSTLGIQRAHAVLANPLAYPYIEGLPIDRVGYLRLDDYPRLPGVDADLVAPADERLLRSADLVFGTARALLPPEGWARKAPVYLPQGVDARHFASVPFREGGPKVLGFFGLLAEWLDSELIGVVADANPEWTLEFRGPVRHWSAELDARPNIHRLPGVPYAELPLALSGWWAAWIPFAITDLTRGVNPLKLREYLAAGFPTASTPLPEVLSLGEDVAVTPTAAAVTEFLAAAERDDLRQRAHRKEAMLAHDWTARATVLRQAFGATP